jgi:uncharacterized membrane protein
MKRFIRDNKVVVGMMLVYVLVVGTVAILRHYTFQTQTWDMGVFTQIMWNASEGKGLVSSLEDSANHLGVHMSPFLFLLIPFYFIFQSPYSLLIIQTLALALGALPLYLLAKEVLNKKWAQVLSFVYFLHPSLHAVNLFDFHAVAFAVPFFLSALYFIYKEKLIWASVFLLLAASTKENAIIATAFVGLFILIKYFRTKKMRSFGLAVFLIASLYFYLTVSVLMPAAGGGLVRFDRYANLGETPGEIIQNVTQEPGLLAETVLTTDKASYVARLFLPVLYTSFLAPVALLPVIPGLVQNLLTFFEFQFTSLYQYDSILLPFIFIAAIFGLRKVILKYPNRQRYLFYGFLLASLISFGLFSILSPRNLPFEKYDFGQRAKTFREIARQIPDEASVTANTLLLPHLAQREVLKMQGTGTLLTDFFILDAQDPFPYKSEAEYQAYLDKILATGLYEINVIDDRYLILVKK